MKKAITLIGFVLLYTAFLGAQSTNKQKQFGNTMAKISSYQVELFNGKRHYTVKNRYGTGGIKVEGDIKIPKKGSPVSDRLYFTGSFEGKSNVNSKIVGLRADFIQLIPEVGLVGILLPYAEMENYKKGKIDTAKGVISWQLNLETGEVIDKKEDEMIVFNPYDFIFATRSLYVYKSSNNNTDVQLNAMQAALFEDAKLVDRWENLSVMAPPRAVGFKKEEVQRFYRYLDGYVQLAEQKEGKSYEVVVFDNKLHLKNRYYPALLLYRNYEKMPDVQNVDTGRNIIAKYRKGEGWGPDQIFHRQVLVPSQELEGLYGVLRADGTVEIPEGSLGLSPVITEEKNAESKTGETYLLCHFFMVAYPGGNDGKMNYAVANPEGKLSYGSDDKPVWTDWSIFTSSAIAENNKNTFVHPELIVARLLDGSWHCYLASRYRSNSFGRYESLHYYFPTPIGDSGATEFDAIVSAEEALLRIENVTRKYNEKMLAEYKERLKREQEKYEAEMAKRRREEQAKWAANNQPQQRSGGSTLFNSTWKGFTYTPETTRRFNQTVNQSNYNNSMTQYNNYLNSKIFGSRY